MRTHFEWRVFACLLCLLAACTAAAQETSGDINKLIADLGLKEADRPARELPGWRAPQVILLAGMMSPIQELQPAAPGAKFVALTNATPAELANADVIVGSCAQDLLTQAKRVRWVQVMSAGVEQCVSSPALQQRQILLTNMQRVDSAVIGEHAIALALALARNLEGNLANQRQGRWGGRGDDVVASMRSLGDKTLLVVGLGGIGTEVAKRAAALGMKVTATRNSSRERPAFVSYVGLSDELPKLAQEADVIVNAAPLTAATTHLFDEKFFAGVKPGAYFINVARGQSVVTDALIAALKNGRLAGAGLDVTDPEPLPSDHPLWRLPNVIITPHVAAASDLPRYKQNAIVRENLRRYAAGEKMLSVVDLKSGY